MIPSIALIGRPNVGKSTLFNKLTRTRNALVANYPGLTRDRQYGRAEWDGHPFVVIDTGGLEGNESDIDHYMAQQSLRAAQEADIIFFIVDARTGLTSADQMIAKSLRRIPNPVYLLANKIDGHHVDLTTVEFYELGFNEVYPITAAQGRGVNQVLNEILLPWIEDHEKQEIKQKILSEVQLDTTSELEAIKNQSNADIPIKVAILGRPNVGKSTLTNRILGEERVIVYDSPGTTRDSIYIPFERNEQKYIIIDTAGVRRRKNIKETVEKFSIIKTLQAIEDTHVVILVIDARENISDQDLTLLGHVIKAGRSIVIAINKWDGLEQDDKEAIKKELDRRLGFIDFAQIHFISALHGSGVGLLYQSIQECFASSTKPMSTSLLTRLMLKAQEEHQPPIIKGRRVKLKYAHTGGHNPPQIVIHGNQVKSLPNHYRRYLINYFRKSLQMVGTPIDLKFQESENPFADRVNSLTQSQIRKRKRMMKFVK